MRVAYVDGQAAGDERAGIGGSGGGRQAKIAMSRQRRGLRGRGLQGWTDGRVDTSNPAAERRGGLCIIIIVSVAVSK